MPRDARKKNDGRRAGEGVPTVVLARSRGLNGYTMLDIAAVVVPMGLFFGRIANFVNGELWGRAAPDFPYAVVFPTGGDVPRYPSQLFEAATEGLLLFVVMALAVRRFGFRKPGLLGGIFVRAPVFAAPGLVPAGWKRPAAAKSLFRRFRAPVELMFTSSAAPWLIAGKDPRSDS